MLITTGSYDDTKQTTTALYYLEITRAKGERTCWEKEEDRDLRGLIS